MQSPRRQRRSCGSSWPSFGFCESLRRDLNPRPTAFLFSVGLRAKRGCPTWRRLNRAAGCYKAVALPLSYGGVNKALEKDAAFKSFFRFGDVDKLLLPLLHPGLLFAALNFFLLISPQIAKKRSALLARQKPLAFVRFSSPNYVRGGKIWASYECGETLGKNWGEVKSKRDRRRQGLTASRSRLLWPRKSRRLL